MKAKIWYLYHSGFAVETTSHFLIFDYWKQTPKNAGLDSGVIDPKAIADKDTIVFVSHNHGDHYNRNIKNWSSIMPKLRYILSSDIPKIPGAIMVGPGETVSQHDFHLQTLESNDEGVAFVVDIDGITIYHAGDLNWWHWEGEPDDYNEGMAKTYKSQIALMKDKRIDIAFVPVDPRLEEQYAWGINHLMQTVDVRYAVPMHYGSDTSVVDRLLSDKDSMSYRDKVLKLTERGASVEISGD